MHSFALLFNCLAVGIFPIISLLLILIICLVFWKKRFSRILLALAIVYLYFSANGTIAKYLVKPLINSQQPISTDAILTHKAMIVLGGGVSYAPNHNELGVLSNSRILEAYRIYHIAKQHHVAYTIFSSGGGKSVKSSEAALYKKLLLQLGVPKKAIIIEPKSKNTYQNAQFLKPILAHYPFKTYLLVTSALHMPRAQLYFSHFGIHTIAAPSDFPYPFVGLIPSSYNLFVQSFALREYIGIARLSVYEKLGLN